jgi:hypothetical protein
VFSKESTEYLLTPLSDQFADFVPPPLVKCPWCPVNAHIGETHLKYFKGRPAFAVHMKVKHLDLLKLRGLGGGLEDRAGRIALIMEASKPMNSKQLAAYARGGRGLRSNYPCSRSLSCDVANGTDDLEVDAIVPLNEASARWNDASQETSRSLKRPRDVSSDESRIEVAVPGSRSVDLDESVNALRMK